MNLGHQRRAGMSPTFPCCCREQLRGHRDPGGGSALRGRSGSGGGGAASECRCRSRGAWRGRCCPVPPARAGAAPVPVGMGSRSGRGAPGCGSQQNHRTRGYGSCRRIPQNRPGLRTPYRAFHRPGTFGTVGAPGPELERHQGSGGEGRPWAVRGSECGTWGPAASPGYRSGMPVEKGFKS